MRVASLDPLFVVRPTLLYPVWTFFLAGCWAARNSRGLGLRPSLDIGIVWTALALTLVMASIYILNQVQDVKSDRANHKLFLIADGYVAEPSAVVEAVLLSTSGLVLGFALGRGIGLLLASLFLLGWLYNDPPVRWKDRTLGGWISNGLLAVFCTSLGWRAMGGAGAVHPFMIGYFLAASAVYLNTTLPDIEGDRRAGKRTFAVRFGPAATVVSAFLLEVSACILAFVFRDWLLFGASLAVGPSFFISAIRRELAPSLRATKASVVALTAGVCVFFPLYLVPVVVVYFLSRWYYRKRFDLDYPSLKAS